MADIVIMGAGLSGAIMAYEMKGQMRPEDKLTVVTKDPLYHFVPSNPWIPVGWRKREAVADRSRADFRQARHRLQAEPGDEALARRTTRSKPPTGRSCVTTI